MVSAMDQDYVILASKIQKQKEIAKGSFGIVYKGLMQGSIEVAIKELYNQNITELAMLDMENEIMITQKMRHPRVISIYGFCQSPLSLIMEFLPQSLLSLLNSKKELSWNARYIISCDIVLGLDYIHQKNIIHRDLKSNNILLDEKLRAKITDFGLSRIRTESKSIESKSQAPELMSAKPKYSKQSDIFALGVIFWEIAARKIPFQEADDQFIERDICKGEREDIPENCPSNYQALIEKCWQQSPSDRATLEFLQSSLKNMISQSQNQALNTVPQSKNVASIMENQIVQVPQEKAKIATQNIVEKMYQITYDQSQDQVLTGHQD